MKNYLLLFVCMMDIVALDGLSVKKAFSIYLNSSFNGRNYEEFVVNMKRTVPVLYAHNILPQHRCANALIPAVLGRSVELVRLLVKSGFDPSFKDFHGLTAYTALHNDPLKKMKPEKDIKLKKEIEEILKSYKPQPDLVTPEIPVTSY
jgi:hypothetical protein